MAVSGRRGQATISLNVSIAKDTRLKRGLLVSFLTEVITNDTAW